MNLSSLVFVDMAFALFVVSLALALVVIGYSQLLKKMNVYQKEADELKKQINQKESRILDEARDKAREIVEDSLEKAQILINDSQSLNSEGKRKLDEALDALIKHQVSYFEKASEDFLSEYRKQLEALKQKNIQIAQNVSESIEKDTISEVENFEDVLKKETYAAQKIVEEKIEDKYSSAEKEVENYKADMFKKVDGQIYKILQNVSKMAIGKGIPLQEHEQLIISALEKAKKDGIGK